MKKTMQFFLFLSLCVSLYAQVPGSSPTAPEPGIFPGTGDTAIALRYLEWAEKELAAGRTAEALAALERGADYRGASSDLSYLLALVRSRTECSRFSVLEGCRLALETMRWARYTPEAARLLEAQTLTELRYFEEALRTLRDCDQGAYETYYWKCRALKGLGSHGEFLRTLGLTMDRFPRRTEPVRLLFGYAAGKEGDGETRQLLDTALRRLPVLLLEDPALAYGAAPFIRDKDEARRYVAAYRALENPDPASLPAALNLGLVDGTGAVEELLSPALDKELVLTVRALLRSAEEGDFLSRNLWGFSGVITEDADHDGVIESAAMYQDGVLVEYRYDADQDRVTDLTVSFTQGLPSQALAAVSEGAGPAFPLDSKDRRQIRFVWEQYPALSYADLEDRRYIPRPRDFFYTPLRFIPLVEEGPDYPIREEPLPVVTERTLLSFAAILEQPSELFAGGRERIELRGGIPVKSRIYLGEKTAAETEFVEGRPLIQRLDMDLDGRMETIRRFDPAVPYRTVLSESDWNGDGIFEYAETLQEDGGLKKSWDIDGDGIRETEQ
jgi:tetratricopeptide (TPR) repeat protein